MHCCIIPITISYIILKAFLSEVEKKRRRFSEFHILLNLLPTAKSVGKVSIKWHKYLHEPWIKHISYYIFERLFHCNGKILNLAVLRYKGEGCREVIYLRKTVKPACTSIRNTNHIQTKIFIFVVFSPILLHCLRCHRRRMECILNPFHNP